MSESDLTVVCGTVFNDILLWCMDKGESHSPIENTVTAAEKRAKVRLSLKGHEVNYNKVLCLPYTTVKSLHPPKKTLTVVYCSAGCGLLSLGQ